MWDTSIYLSHSDKLKLYKNNSSQILGESYHIEVWCEEVFSKLTHYICFLTCELWDNEKLEK